MDALGTARRLGRREWLAGRRERDGTPLLSELGQALDAVRDSLTEQLAQPSVRSVTEGAKREVAFRRKLIEHADELKRSPGIAWFDLVQGEFSTMRRVCIAPPANSTPSWNRAGALSRRRAQISSSRCA